jgi:hypothetical protein
LALLFVAACTSTTTVQGTTDASAGSDAAGTSETNDDASATDESADLDSASPLVGEAAVDASEPSCKSTAAGCVACGSGGCSAPSLCCGSTTSTAVCKPPQCNANISIACDGAEDCTGGKQCCVSFQVMLGATTSYASTCGDPVSSAPACNISTALASSDAHGNTVACQVAADCANVYEGAPGSPDPQQPDRHCCILPGARAGVCTDDFVEPTMTAYGATCL